MCTHDVSADAKCGDTLLKLVTDDLEWIKNTYGVMSKWNVRLNLSWMAVTKTFGMLWMQLLFEVLGESTGFVGLWVIHDDEGVGDIPGVQGGSGGL